VYVNGKKLAEYSHIEAELDFITFDNLLAHLEHIICRVIELIVDNPVAAEKIKKYNPGFSKPSRPFLRMRYVEAIDWLRKRGIKNTEGEDHVFGDDM
jgi:asparaginyl-tRNA synthetase